LRNVQRTLASRSLFWGLGTLLCSLMAACGTNLSMLPSESSKAVPGVPGAAILGYFWSSNDGTLRPLLGVTGSAQVGQSIVASGAYVSGVASIPSGLGLVEDQKGNLFSLNLPSSKATLIATGLPAPSQIVFSPQGADAIVYASGATSLTLISALNSQPQTMTIALPSGAKLLAAIVSDAGTVLVATQTAPVAIDILSPGGALLPLSTVAQPGGMSFLPGIENALIADRGKNTLSLLQNVSTSLAVHPLSATGINLPVAVASSRDSRWAVVANGGDKNILRIDLENGTAPSILSCSCQATQLSALAGVASFRLNDLGNGPLWIADLSGPTPQVLFVPAIHQTP
jgi:hypothetical protein